MSLTFYHTIPASPALPQTTNTLTYEATVTLEGTTLVSRYRNPYTGATHERYFETLDEFARWHYGSLNWAILDPLHNFHAEVKVALGSL